MKHLRVSHQPGTIRMFLAFAGLLAASQIIEARVAIDVGIDGASVEIDYVFSAPVESLRFDAIRWPAQTISLADTAGLKITHLDGSLRVEPTVSGAENFRLVYGVTGSLERIPLFVPQLPTVPGTSRVTISVSGVAAGVSLLDAFPRLIREGDGTLLGQPANLPSFVLIPIQGRVSRARLADGMVLLMLVVASGVWIVRRSRSGP